MSKNDKEKRAHDEEPELLFDVADKQRRDRAANQAGPKAQEAPAGEAHEAAGTDVAPEQAEPAKAEQVEEAVKAAVREHEDKYLRLLAEYDNYRKRSLKEKETAWSTAKADTAKEFLPVYDNLERALRQETADEAYAKGVQMTMTQLRGVLEKLGIEEIPALGQPFDPNLHNAVMHMEDESLGENTVAEVFQTGFRLGDRVIRHAMVKVAN